jgi:ribosomal protein S10
MNSDIAYYVDGIMQGAFQTIKDVHYSKMYNDHFEIITKKRNCILVVDKRQIPHNVYHDIRTAYQNIVLNHAVHHLAVS